MGRQHPLLTLVSLSIATFTSSVVRADDYDGDGTDDSVDVCPCDPSGDTESYAPAFGVHGVSIFEDQWPGPSDLDFNDVVIAHNIVVKSLDGKATRIRGTFSILALGGTFNNGLGWRLPIPSSRLTSGSSVRLYTATETAVIEPSFEDGQLSFDISANLRELFDGRTGTINSDPATQALPAQTLVVEIELQPTELDLTRAPFDLYIFRSEDRTLEIHAPLYGGTSKMNGAYDPKQLKPGDSRNFVDAAGLPYAVRLPVTALYPAEGVPIEQLYPRIVDFARSGGGIGSDFYDEQQSVPAKGYAPVNRALPAFLEGRGPSFEDPEEPSCVPPVVDDCVLEACPGPGLDMATVFRAGTLTTFGVSPQTISMNRDYDGNKARVVSGGFSYYNAVGADLDGGAVTSISSYVTSRMHSSILFYPGLWFIADDFGVYRQDVRITNPNQVNMYADNVARPVTIGGDVVGSTRRIYVVTRVGEVSRISYFNALGETTHTYDTTTHVASFPDDEVWAVDTDATTMFVGTRSGRMYRFSKDTQGATFSRASAWVSESVGLALTRPGNLIMHTSRNLFIGVGSSLVRLSKTVAPTSPNDVLYVTGVAGSGTSEGPSTSGFFSGIGGITAYLDTIYLADSGNRSIRTVEPAGTLPKNQAPITTVNIPAGAAVTTVLATPNVSLYLNAVTVSPNRSKVYFGDYSTLSEYDPSTGQTRAIGSYPTYTSGMAIQSLAVAGNTAFAATGSGGNGTVLRVFNLTTGAHAVLGNLNGYQNTTTIATTESGRLFVAAQGYVGYTSSDAALFEYYPTGHRRTVVAGAGAALTWDNAFTAVTADDQFVYVSAGREIRRFAINATHAGFGAGAVVTNALPTNPSQLTLSGDYIYVSAGNDILKVTKATGAITYVAGGGPAFADGDNYSAFFSYPRQIAVSGTSLYVADGGNARLRRITAGPIFPTHQGPTTTTDLPAGGAVSTVVAQPDASIWVSGIAASPTQSLIYFSDYATVKSYDPVTGEIKTIGSYNTYTSGMQIYSMAVAGNTAFMTAGSGGAGALIREMNLTTGASFVLTGFNGYQSGATIASSPSGRIFAAAQGYSGYGSALSDGVFEVHRTGVLRTIVAPRGSLLTADNAYTAVAADDQYVFASSGKEIRRFGVDAAGVEFSSGILVTDALNGTVSSLTLAGNYLYATVGESILKIDKFNGATTIVAAGGPAFSDGDNYSAYFSGLRQIAAAGNALYVTDGGNARVRRVTAGSAFPTHQGPSAPIAVSPTSVVSTIDTGNWLGGVASTPDLSKIIYADYSTLKSYDLATGVTTTIGSYPTYTSGMQIYQLAVAGNVAYMVTGSGGPGVVVRSMNLSTGASAVITSLIGYQEPASITTTPSGRILVAGRGFSGYVGNEGVFEISPNGASRVIIPSRNVGVTADTTYAAIAADDQYVYVARGREIRRLPIDAAAANFEAGTPIATLSEIVGSLILTGNGLYATLASSIVHVSLAGGVTVVGGDVAGNVEGPLASARFQSLRQLAPVAGGGMVVVDAGNRSVRTIR